MPSGGILNLSSSALRVAGRFRIPVPPAKEAHNSGFQGPQPMPELTHWFKEYMALTNTAGDARRTAPGEDQRISCRCGHQHGVDPLLPCRRFLFTLVSRINGIFRHNLRASADKCRGRC